MTSKAPWLVSLALLLITGAALADIEVYPIVEKDVPFAMGPSNYQNSPSIYANSSSTYDNAVSTYANSPSTYANSPSNYANGPHGKQRLLDGKQKVIGYYTVTDKNVVNYYSVAGKRICFRPGSGKTMSVFLSEQQAWAGTVLERRGKTVLGLVPQAYDLLIK